MSALDAINASSGVSRTVALILDGALQAEWDAAMDGLDEIASQESDNGSLALPAVTAAIDHMESLRERVRDSEVKFLFNTDGLSWTEYLQMQADNPPRDGAMLDRIRGFNVDTFYPALIRVTCAGAFKHDSAPEPVPDESWTRLLGRPATEDDEAVTPTLNLKQVNKLADAAWYVMNGESRVPPSARSLLVSQDFGASLALPSPGQESAPSDSADGNPSGSRSTITKKKARTKAGSPAR